MTTGNFKSDFKEALLSLDKLNAILVFNMFEETTINHDFIEEIMVPTLHDIGKGWNNGEIALAQVYISGVICEEIVTTKYGKEEVINNDKTKIAIVTLDDYHALGKKIVYSVFRANHFNIHDFGSGLNVDEVVKLVIENNIKILIVSVLMLKAALDIIELRRRLDESNIDVKLVVGGAPFRLDNSLWKRVGADAMGDAPMDTLDVIKNMKGVKYDR